MKFQLSFFPALLHYVTLDPRRFGPARRFGPQQKRPKRLAGPKRLGASVT